MPGSAGFQAASARHSAKAAERLCFDLGAPDAVGIDDNLSTA
jgi:hypothetical protein